MADAPKNWLMCLRNAWEQGEKQDRNQLRLCASAITFLMRAIKAESGVQEVRPLLVNDNDPSGQAEYDVLHALTLVTEASRAADDERAKRRARESASQYLDLIQQQQQ